MRGHAAHDMFLELVGLDGRVVQQAQLVVVPGVEGEQVRFVGGAEVQAEGEGVEDGEGGFVEGLVEGGGEGAVAREGGFGEPDVGLERVVLGADFVAFLGGVSGVVRERGARGGGV